MLLGMVDWLENKVCVYDLPRYTNRPIDVDNRRMGCRETALVNVEGRGRGVVISLRLGFRASASGGNVG